MRLTSLVVWCLLVFGMVKLTVYGFGQVMKQMTDIQHTYASIGEQFDDPDILQTTNAIAALGH